MRKFSVDLFANNQNPKKNQEIKIPDSLNNSFTETENYPEILLSKRESSHESISSPNSVENTLISILLKHNALTVSEILQKVKLMYNEFKNTNLTFYSVRKKNNFFL